MRLLQSGRRVRSHLGVLVLVVSGLVLAGGSSATASTSPVGVHTYNDSVGDTGETLTINADGTLGFSSGCNGFWVQSGSIISMMLDSTTCSGSWVFTGKISKRGLSKITKPGIGLFGLPGSAPIPFTWYATTP